MTDAYRQAGFSTKQNTKSLQNAASKLWNSARVKTYCVGLDKKREAQRSRRDAGTHARVLHCLWLEATPPGVTLDGDRVDETTRPDEIGRGESGPARLTALTRIGQTISMYNAAGSRAPGDSDTASAVMIAEISEALATVRARREKAEQGLAIEAAIDVTPALSSPRGQADDASGAEVSAEWAEIAKGSPPRS